MTGQLKISGIIRESIVDGPGYRFTIFCQGCPHHCKGCHNPQTHPFEGGKAVCVDKLFQEIKNTKLIKGVTFSGGEPFCQAKPFAELAKMVHQIGMDVITYTGYTFEELIAGANRENGWLDLLYSCDYLIDGRFILAEKTLTLKFRGSKNQRIIDVKKSLEHGSVITTEL